MLYAIVVIRLLKRSESFLFVFARVLLSVVCLQVKVKVEVGQITCNVILWV